MIRRWFGCRALSGIGSTVVVTHYSDFNRPGVLLDFGALEFGAEIFEQFAVLI